MRINPTGNNAISNALRSLQKQIDQLRAAQSPGVVTSVTSNGVHRRPITKLGKSGGGNDKPVYI